MVGVIPNATAVPAQALSRRENRQNPATRISLITPCISKTCESGPETDPFAPEARGADSRHM